jgi:hypothetical protein
MLRRIVFLFCLVVAISSPKRVPAQAAVTAQEETDSKKCQIKDCEQEENYWHRAFRPEYASTWAGAAATLLAGLAAIGTLGFIVVQNRSVKAAADAAKVSADIASSVERAWLITNVTFSSNWPDVSKQGGPVKSVMITQITNSGRSPAEIQSAHIVGQLVPKDWILPTEPVYGDIEDFYEVDSAPGEIIGVGDKRYIISPIQRFNLLSDEQIMNVRAGDLALYCYGRIIYNDISTAQRVTQFGYKFYTRTGGMDGKPEGMYRLNNRKYNYTQ